MLQRTFLVFITRRRYCKIQGNHVKVTSFNSSVVYSLETHIASRIKAMKEECSHCYIQLGLKFTLSSENKIQTILILYQYFQVTKHKTIKKYISSSNCQITI